MYFLEFSDSANFTGIAFDIFALFSQSLHFSFDGFIVFLFDLCHFGDDDIHAIGEGFAVVLIDFSAFIHKL